MKNIFKAFLKIALSVIVLYYVFTKIDIREVYGIIKSANFFYLTAALILFAFSKVVSSFRLNYYFKAVNLPLTEKSNLRLYLLGMYYNLFLPGGIGGDGYKVWLLNKKFGIKIKDLFWSVMIDRVNGVYALFVLALLMVPFLNLDRAFTIGAIALIPVSLAVFVMVHKLSFRRFYQVIAQTTFLSVAVQLLQLGAAVFILFANDSFGNLPAYLFLFLVSSIVATLPITIGGIGSREVTFLFGAKLLNLDIHLSIALSLLFYIITVIVSICGVYYSFNSNALKLQVEHQADNHSNVLL